MFIDKHLNFKAKWEPYLGEDEDTRTSKFGRVQEIDCHKYGKTLFIREGGAEAVVNAHFYIVLENVKPKDKLDGQIVKSVDEIPDMWKGKIRHRECLTWNE